MIVAFTGTLRGMTGQQYDRVCGVYEHLQPDYANHGCAEGADRGFHGIANKIPRGLHPSNEKQHQWALANSRNPDVIHPIILGPRPELKRNLKMVKLSECLIAAPRSTTEILRSGTWATIRYARKAMLPIYICWPDGTYIVDQFLPNKEIR